MVSESEGSHEMNQYKLYTHSFTFAPRFRTGVRTVRILMLSDGYGYVRSRIHIVVSRNLNGTVVRGCVRPLTG